MHTLPIAPTTLGLACRRGAWTQLPHLRAIGMARKKTLRALILCLITVVLGGCIWTPGQYLSARSAEGDRLIENGQVKLVQITPELVAANRSALKVEEVPAELRDYRPDSYRISPGDTLIVTVWDHPELTAPAGSQQQALTNGRLVYPDGTLFYPYAGAMKVSGMTIEELRRTLTEKLGRYLRNPQVDVNVVGHGGRVALQGAFTNTAPLDVTTTPLTLSQAIGRAGINAELADRSGFVLTRDGQSYWLDLDALNRRGSIAPDIYLKPGDYLYLPFNDRKEVYVVGEVLRPQAITFNTTDMSLTQALGRAGGLNQVTSNGDAVYVIRGIEMMGQGQAPATVYHLRAKSPVAFAMASDFSVKAGDVVFVGPAGITRWHRFLSQLLPLSSILSNAANAQNDLGN